MTASRFVSTATFTVLAVTLACASAGCNGDDKHNASRGKGAALTPKKLNEVTADSKLRDAEAAEQRGDYARALESYEQLRSYPQPSRPDDLDARIARVEKKMKKQQ